MMNEPILFRHGRGGGLSPGGADAEIGKLTPLLYPDFERLNRILAMGPPGFHREGWESA